MCTTHATLPTRTATPQNGSARGLVRTLSWANGSIAIPESTTVVSRPGNDLVYLLRDPGRPRRYAGLDPVVPRAARAAHDYSADISDKVQRGRKRCTCMAWSDGQPTSGSAEMSV